MLLFLFGRFPKKGRAFRCIFFVLFFDALFNSAQDDITQNDKKPYRKIGGDVASSLNANFPSFLHPI